MMGRNGWDDDEEFDVGTGPGAGYHKRVNTEASTTQENDQHFHRSPIDPHRDMWGALDRHFDGVAVKHGIDLHIDDDPETVEETEAMGSLFPGSNLLPILD